MLHLEGLICSPGGSGGSCWWAVPPECSQGADPAQPTCLEVPGLVVPRQAPFGRGQNGTVPLPAFLWMWEHEEDFRVVGGNEKFMAPMP